MSTGWVYVLSNPSIPNKVKVGTTKNRPEERAKELCSTGVPTPFKVETAMLFANKAEQIEHKTHDVLTRAGIPKNKEFFDCDARIAAEKILTAAEILDEAVLKTEPILIPEEEIREAKRKKWRIKKQEEERLQELQRLEQQQLEEQRRDQERTRLRLQEYERTRKRELKKRKKANTIRDIFVFLLIQIVGGFSLWKFYTNYTSDSDEGNKRTSKHSAQMRRHSAQMRRHLEQMEKQREIVESYEKNAKDKSQ